MKPSLTGSRVLFVSRSTTFHENSGGMEVSTSALARAVQDLGAETALVTTQAGSGPIPTGLDGHVDVWTVMTRRPGRYSRSWWRATASGGPWTDWNPHLIIGEGDGAASFTARGHVTPVIVHAHGTTVMEARSAMSMGVRGIPRCLLNLLRTPHRLRHLRAADEVIAAGPAVQQSLIGWPYRIHGETIQTIFNSVDFYDPAQDLDCGRRVRDILAIEEGVPLLLAAGRLAADKGTDTAIRTVPLVPGSHLVVVGDGPERQRLGDLAKSLCIAERVHFLGRRSQASLTQLMASADVLVFPTRRREGLPMIVLEAAACGLPIVSTTVAGLPADLQSSQVILVDSSAGVEEFAGAIQRQLARQGTHLAYLPEAYSTTTLASRIGPMLSRRLGVDL